MSETTQIPHSPDEDLIEGVTILQDGSSDNVVVGLRRLEDLVFRVNVVKNSTLVETKDFNDYIEAVRHYQTMRGRYLGR